MYLDVVTPEKKMSPFEGAIRYARPKARTRCRDPPHTWFLGRIQLALCAFCRTLHTALRAWITRCLPGQFKSRRAPFRHRTDGRVYGLDNTALHGMSSPLDTANGAQSVSGCVVTGETCVSHIFSLTLMQYYQKSLSHS